MLRQISLVTALAGLSLPARAAEVQAPVDIEGGGEYAKTRKDPGELGGVPAVFRTPETGLGGGAVLIYIPAKDKEKVSSVLAGFLYTEKKQFLTALYTEQYFGDDLWAAELYTTFQDYPDSFFGIGDDTLAEDEETYTWRERKVAFSIRRLLSKDLRIGINTNAQSDDFSSLKEDGLLASGDVLGVEGGDARALGASIRWDTYDDGYSPTHGEVVNFGGLRYDDAFGSDVSYNAYDLNLKKFWSLGEKDVIGAQLYAAVTTGDVPFYQLAHLGGKNLLRGYFYGRYRDRNMVVFQTEYRRRLFGRFGGVVFAGAGDVAHEPDGFTAKDLKPSGGFGLRYQLVEQQRINVRLDFGFGQGEENPSVYLYILEAF